MSAVSKEAFRKPVVPTIQREPVPELGKDEAGGDRYVCVRAISAKDFREMRASRGDQPETGDTTFVYDLLARTLCDDAGTPLFDSPQDVADNFGLSMPALDSLVAAALKVSGIGTTEKN